MQPKKLDRNQFIDFCKGVTIVFVVVGHVIQVTNVSFYTSSAFIFIYSFHMPLLIGISGYLFSKTMIKNNPKEIITTKLKQLIFPLISWTFLLVMFTNIINDEKNYSLASNVKSFVSLTPRFFWFLPVLFFLCVILIVLYKYLTTNSYRITFLVIIYIIPDFSSFKYLKYLLPFFILGYHLEYIQTKLSSNKHNTRRIIELVSLAIFIILLIKWKSQYYIYTSGMNIISYSLTGTNISLQQTFIVLYRLLIGLVGCISITFLMQQFYQYTRAKKIKLLIEKLGNYSLGIYCTHLIIINHTYFKQLLKTGIIKTEATIIIASTLLLLVSWYLTYLLNKNKYTKIYLLGGR